MQVKPADTLHLEDEIRRLQAQNTALQRNISGIEKRCKDTEQSRVGEVQVKPADTLHLEDEIRRLQAQNTALQRNISGKLKGNILWLYIYYKQQLLDVLYGLRICTTKTCFVSISITLDVHWI